MLEHFYQENQSAPLSLYLSESPMLAGSDNIPFITLFVAMYATGVQKMPNIDHTESAVAHTKCEI